METEVTLEGPRPEIQQKTDRHVDPAHESRTTIPSPDRMPGTTAFRLANVEPGAFQSTTSTLSSLSLEKSEKLSPSLRRCGGR